MYSSLEAELAVIGACIIDQSVARTVAMELAPAHFASEPCKLAYSAILQNIKDGVTSDVVTLGDTVRRIASSEFASAAAIEVIVDAIATTPVATNGAEYADIIKRAWRLRQISIGARRLAEEAERHDATPSAIANSASSLVAMIHDAGVSAAGATDIAVLSKQATAMISATEPELKYGLPALDAVMGGIRRGETTIIGAGTSQGKTTTMLNIALALLGAGKRVRYVAFENVGQMVPRMAAMWDSLPLRIFLRPWEFQADSKKLCVNAIAKVESFGSRLSIMPPSSVQTVSASLDLNPADVVVFDYVQKYALTFGDQEAQSRHAMVSKAYAEMYDIATRHNVAVFVLSQVTRREQSWSKAGELITRPPTMHDLKESGDLENFSDNVILLWWPWRETLNAEKHNPSHYNAIVAKAKMGEPTSVRLNINRETLRVYA